MLDIKVPTVGESISEVRVSRIIKKEGEFAFMDEILCELESEKASFELNAEKAGIIHWKIQEGDDVAIGAIVCSIDTAAPAPKIAEPTKETDNPKITIPATPKEEKKTEIQTSNQPVASPAAQKIAKENNIPLHSVNATGKGNRLTKQDVLKALNANKNTNVKSRNSRLEKMSPIRKTISKKLVAAKNNTAMLTTFNEVDMTSIMEIRNKYKDVFKEQHGVGLGFMSFFIKACCEALKQYPAVNAQINDDQILYFDYCDVSIAVSTPKGLVVPIIRNVESLSMADIEKTVAELALKGRDNKLTMEDMTGGTFTISNGGVFGSLMSTPILNAPQSAILGMHKIQERPMAINGKVEIRPMMYLALSYDHRIIDGKESVGFLVKVKELLENPTQLILGYDVTKALLDIV